MVWPYGCVSTKSIDKYFLQSVGHGTVVDTARMLLELIFIRDGSLYVNLPCFAQDVLLLISYFFLKFFLVPFVYDVIININIKIF